ALRAPVHNITLQALDTDVEITCDPLLDLPVIHLRLDSQLALVEVVRAPPVTNVHHRGTSASLAIRNAKSPPLRFRGGGRLNSPGLRFHAVRRSIHLRWNVRAGYRLQTPGTGVPISTLVDFRACIKLFCSR